MKLEDQVVSLELSKKLKELGFPQESLFYWDLDINQVVDKDWDSSKENMISAYTVAELGEMLPENVFTGKPITNAFKQKWNCRLGNTVKSVYADTEAESRAKMLIYIKENKLI